MPQKQKFHSSSTKHSLQVEKSYRNLVIIFTFFAILLVVGVFYFTLSKAVVTITPDWKNRDITFALQIKDTSSSSPEFISGKLDEQTFTYEQDFKAPTRVASSTKATGVITIINNSTHNQTLVAKTQFQASNNLIYRLDNTVVVKSKSKIEVPATADSAGETYVIGESKLKIIKLWEGMQSQIYGQTTGFTLATSTDYEITPEALSSATEQIKQAALEKALTTINNQDSTLQTNSQLASTTKEIIEVIKTNLAQGVFTIKSQLTIKYLLVNQAELLTKVQNQIPSDLDNKLKIADSQGELQYKVEFLDQNADQILAQIKGSYTLKTAAIQVLPVDLKSLSREAAIKLIKDNNDVSDVSITLPIWKRNLPFLADNIKIVIKQK